jgi:hypothetical protein
VFALLQANWPVVQRVVNALCKQDRITSLEFDDLITGKRWRSRKKSATRHLEADNSRMIASNDGVSMHTPSLVGE